MSAENIFDEIVVNVGREVGSGLRDIASYIERDSTYGRLGTYLHGCKACTVIDKINEADGTMEVNGVLVRILRQSRNPQEIAWKANDVRLVVDTTGVFNDPTADQDDPERRPARPSLCRGRKSAAFRAFQNQDQRHGDAG